MRHVIIALGALALSGTAYADIISSTSQDGNHTALECLFNGSGYAAHCAGTPANGGDGWITGGSALDPNAEYVTSTAWETGALFASGTAIVIEIAGNKASNSFGLYDLHNPNNRLEVFSGADSEGPSSLRFIISMVDGVYQINFDAGTAVELGGSFGFYLSGPGGTFYSDATRNPNGDTQMVAFQGDGERQANFFGTGSKTWLSNEWILAWEDLAYGGSDKDFNDFVVMIESVIPVPAPAPLGLLGIGLIGIGLVRRMNSRGTSTS